MQRRVWRSLESQAAELCERFGMRRHGRTAVRIADAIGEQAEGPLRGDRRVELPKRPGRGVPWIHERTTAVAFDPLIELLEIGVSHEDLTAHLNEFRNR